MLRDTQGLEVTTDSPEAVAAIDHFVDQLLVYGNNPEVILKGVETDPTSVLINAQTAALHLFAETADAPAQAAPYLKVASEHLVQATEREQLYFSAINAWANGEIDQAISYHEIIADKFPHDIHSVQVCQYHYFNLGDKYGLLKIAEKVFPANAENHYIYGMLAFGLEQCHHLDEAEVVGRKATEMNRRDPWAHHAVAHVLETQGRLDEGINWMESLSDVWQECGTFYTHNWWHVALYYLDKEDFGKVLEIYDTHIWGRAVKEYSQCQVDAIAMLLRLELRGVDVGNRWQEIATYIAGRLYEHVMPFLDLHYVYVLARVRLDDLVIQMLESLQAFAQSAKPFIRQTWTDVAVPAAQGMVAYARGEWAIATTLLGSVLPQLYLVGGSHAQRDLFEQVYLDALIRAEKNTEALQLLQKRAVARNNIPSIHRGIALINKKLELTTEVN